MSSQNQKWWDGRQYKVELAVIELIEIGLRADCYGIDGYGCPVDSLVIVMLKTPKNETRVWKTLRACGEHTLGSAGTLKLKLDGANGVVSLGGETRHWPTFVEKAQRLFHERGLDRSLWEE